MNKQNRIRCVNRHNKVMVAREEGVKRWAKMGLKRGERPRSPVTEGISPGDESLSTGNTVTGTFMVSCAHRRQLWVW